jgi:spermidine/putrescine transport system ATP-binding protein
LLDEPLGALDLKLRRQMQIELKWIQTQVGLTFVHVTHDQEEAMTMADTIAVMNEGRIEQMGTPEDLYESPRTAFVANFLGQSNLIRGTISGSDGENNVVEVHGQKIAVPKSRTFSNSNNVLFGIRPEKIDIDFENEPGDGNILRGGKVVDVAFVGVSTQYQVEMPWGQELMVFEQNDGTSPMLELGDQVRLQWMPKFTFGLDGAQDADAGSEVNPEE